MEHPGPGLAGTFHVEHPGPGLAGTFHVEHPGLVLVTSGAPLRVLASR